MKLRCALYSLGLMLAVLLPGVPLLAGPWFTQSLGHQHGDAVTHDIPVSERVYVFSRPGTSERKKRNEMQPIAILWAKAEMTLGTVVKQIKTQLPADYPRFFVIVCRESSDPVFQAEAANALKSDFPLLARDVVWIGFSI